MKLCVLLVVVAACDRRPAVTSCDDDLHGVWITPTGARWMLLDNDATLEAYPLFDDGVADAAPRVIDLHRGEKLTLTGDVKRRYQQQAAICEARSPIRIAKCKANELQIVLADPQPPLQMSPCAWGQPAASRIEHWRRE